MHHLRLSIMAVAVVLLGTSLYFSPYVRGFERMFLAQIGSIGINVGVAPNQYNTLAQQLEEKEEALNAREQELKSRIAAIERESSALSGSDAQSYGYFAFGGASLFLLILLNFFLDYHARRRAEISSSS